MSTISQAISQANLNNSPANTSVASNVKGVGKTDAIINMIYFTDASETVINVYGRDFPVVPHAGNVQLLKFIGDNAKALPTDKLYTLAAAVCAGYVSPTHQRDMASDTDKPVTVCKAPVQAVTSPLDIARKAIIADLQSYIDMLNAGDALITSLTLNGFTDVTITRTIDLSEARKADSLLKNKEHIDRATSLFDSIDDTIGIMQPSPDEAIALGNSKAVIVYEPTISIDAGLVTIKVFGEKSKATFLANRASTRLNVTAKVTAKDGANFVTFPIATV